MRALCGTRFGALQRHFGLTIRVSGALHPLCFMVNRALYVTGDVEPAFSGIVRPVTIIREDDRAALAGTPSMNVEDCNRGLAFDARTPEPAFPAFGCG